MFAAKSDLTGISPAEILTMDSKQYQLGETKLHLASLETVNPAPALAMEADLIEAMATLKERDSLDGVMLFVIDILNGNATLIAPTQFERELAAKAFSCTFTGNRAELPGVVSRKKQIVPPLEALLV
jgi:manganese-dependent inorganic pyrophosphatase